MTLENIKESFTNSLTKAINAYNKFGEEGYPATHKFCEQKKTAIAAMTRMLLDAGFDVIVKTRADFDRNYVSNASIDGIPLNFNQHVYEQEFPPSEQDLWDWFA